MRNALKARAAKCGGHADGSQAPRGSLPFRMRLNTPEACRRTLARMARAVASGKIDGKLADVLRRQINSIVTLFRMEEDVEINRRIKAIEEMVRRQGGQI